VSLDFKWLEIFFAGLSTLAIFSFLYRENSVYRFFEHFYIGIATSYGIIETVRSFLYPKVLAPLLGYDLTVFPDGSLSSQYNTNNLLWLLPMSFGLLYYSLLTKKHRWLAQLVIGCQLGYAAGLTFKGTFIELMPQIFDSYRPLYVPGSFASTISNIIFVTTLFSSLSYFFFTFKRTDLRSGTLSFSARSLSACSGLGRWMMMGCFGAFFGSTIMARMALLIERLQFLINVWIPSIF
jgi:hypothetical protein